MEILNQLNPMSPVRRYLEWMHHCGNDELYREKYQHIVKAQQHGSVFLTVVIRTQGKREMMLQDVFLCLQAQTDHDFEIVIICHRTTENDFQKIKQMIQRQPNSFVRKIRVCEMKEGERGAPINMGFAMAKGRYAVCLDDDDLVFDHWVQAFHQAENGHEGMILHAWALTQEWKALTNSTVGSLGITAAGKPDGKYCVHYGTLAQQYENYCPFMGIAFPLFLFREMHIMVDEHLTSTEDWDYLQRTAGIAGVYDIEKTTAIYRLWNTGDVSHEVVSFEEWEDNYIKSSAGTKEVPILLNEEEAALCKRELTGMQSAEEKGRSCFMKEAVLFWSHGEPFSDNRHIKAPVILKDGWMQISFLLEKKKGVQNACRIRIDPADETMFCLEQIEVILCDSRKHVRRFTISDARETNGLVDGGKLIFLTDDPKIIFDLEQEMEICRVSFKAKVSYQCPKLIEEWAETAVANAKWYADNINKAHIYLDTGEGFSERFCLEQSHVFHGEEYEAVFKIPKPDKESYQGIRLDPIEGGMIWLEKLDIRMVNEYEHVEIIKPSDFLFYNGFETSDGIAFIGKDPYICLPIREGTIISVLIHAKIHFVDMEKMEMLLAHAVNVPDYDLVFNQMNQINQSSRIEMGAEEHE